MKIINSLKFIILIVGFSMCNGSNSSKGKCFIKQHELSTKNAKLLLYIDSALDKNCTYSLGSFYLDNLPLKRKLIFDGKDILVDLSTNGKFDILFSFKDRENNKRIVKIKHKNWLENKGKEYVLKSYSVELLKKVELFNKEKFAIIKIEKLISAFPKIGIMDGILIFSDREGFIGSYFQKPNKLDVIQKSGNILEDLVDYSNFKFRRIN